ncbi:MAG: hypothetical protein HYY50_02630 [Candidatus Kerfeldbacteria bacterium]|nr:hypothetical protein [Candidatus Kerfeldbacteria bacterium]
MEIAKPPSRTLYLALTMLLGVTVSYGLHALIELWYLSWAQNTGRLITWTRHLGIGLCALPRWLQYGLLAAGLVGGFLTGRVWWRWVYGEGRRWPRRKMVGTP